MARAARSTINRKLTIAIVATTGGSLLVACLIFIAYDMVTIRRSMVERVRTLAEVIAILRDLGDDGEAGGEPGTPTTQ